jgi:serine/threonine protein kinase
MELLQGVPLSELREFTFARIVDIGKQISEALAYIHDQGFLYRDLKPGNLMLEKCGFHYCVKLFDFGLARPRGEAYLPNESYRAGTVFYLAPELIAGQPADTGADLYALGATLYEMITGRVPFFNIDEEHILAEHLEESVSPPSQSRSDVPPALETIVLRLLEKDPDARFTSAREVCEALEQVTITHRSVPHGNLPPSQADGRENEIEQVIHLFESHQVVTLLHDDHQLALAVGTRLMEEFPEGVWLVEVATVDEPIMLLPTVASLLGVRGDGHRSLTVALLEWLREKQLLIIFKQCHYLLPACSQLVETIIEACPEVYILGTSSLPLNVSGETCYGSQFA